MLPHAGNSPIKKQFSVPSPRPKKAASRTDKMIGPNSKVAVAWVNCKIPTKTIMKITTPVSRFKMNRAMIASSHYTAGYIRSGLEKLIADCTLPMIVAEMMKGR